MPTFSTNSIEGGARLLTQSARRFDAATMPNRSKKVSDSERPPVAKSVSLTGRGLAELERSVRQISSRNSWPVHQPFPTTRELGERFGISNASVCRILKKLHEEQVIWRSDNGRYYSADSEFLLKRRRPYACLVRKLQTWSRSYQGIMSGFSQAFARNNTSMLFVHNESLIRHADTNQPPLRAGEELQIESLTDFFRNHRGQFNGILLDDVWLDSVLERFANELTNAVIVCRPTRLPGVSSVSVDYDTAGLMAMGHLYARGFEEIWLGVPIEHAGTIEAMNAAAAKAAAQLGRPILPKNIIPLAYPEDRDRLVVSLRATKKRIGIYCPEDNVAARLREQFQAAGIGCPERVGLLSGMGTSIVVDRQVSSVRIDYEGIGRTAGEIMESGRKQVVRLPPELYSGQTT